ncbi:MAG: GNAT family N-acetyltransferase [Rhodospirillales bacterium]|nr:GNAT family N-acetyltransferase [Rhodospirillales bacterium]
MSIAITRADGDRDMEIVRELFEEYQKVIDVDLCFQDFEKELKSLPGAYAPPKGCLLLARDGEEVAGVVGMWPHSKGGAEMKRLYVRPPWRGSGLGRVLAEVVVEAAIEAGHKSICLDTLGFMAEARKLYKSLGFVEIPAYYDNPLDDVLYMELSLE